jgi:2-phospho-L-lactate guanylyltransferase (CobY/MobA/RfbA family)
MVDSSMKPEQTYQNLKELAEKLGVVVSEQNLRSTGIKAKSGLCKVKGKNIIIIEKKLPLQDKNEILASCLSKLPHEDIFMVPALREFLNSFHP